MVEEQLINMNYQIFNKYFQNDFTDLIKQILNTKNEKGKVISIFDVGCYVGNFSKKIKDSLKNDYKLNFIYLILIQILSTKLNLNFIILHFQIMIKIIILYISILFSQLVDRH